MTWIKNPILPGFNPDPSILRVGEDYFIATSTFEWYPGIAIYHSKNLASWNLINYGLKKKTQIKLDGIPDSGGVWAPCLSYAHGRFYLVYSFISEFKFPGPIIKPKNYLIWTDDIYKDWSDPIYLNDTGFDPSLFHDGNRSWLLNMKWDNDSENHFQGILLQEYNLEKKCFIGEEKCIFKGTSLGSVEGPYLYKVDNLYYLLTAEGGTSYGHAVTLALSKNIEGPYNVSLNSPILTSRNNPNHPIQKAGHGSLVKTPKGNWYLAHLGSRPIGGLNVCPLGRESFIQKIKWNEGVGPCMDNGSTLPEETFEVDEFLVDEKQNEDLNLMYLRGSEDFQKNSLVDSDNSFRIEGGDFPTSKNNVALIGKKQDVFNLSFSAEVSFYPKYDNEGAGITYFYNTNNFYYLYMSLSDKDSLSIYLVQCIKGDSQIITSKEITPSVDEVLELKCDIQGVDVRFSYKTSNSGFQEIEGSFDGSFISDEGASPYGFTGAFFGICAHSLGQEKNSAIYRSIKYIKSPEK